MIRSMLTEEDKNCCLSAYEDTALKVIIEWIHDRGRQGLIEFHKSAVVTVKGFPEI